MKEITVKTIWISKDAYFHLKRIMRQQRGCRPLSVEFEERVWSRIPNFRKRGELVQVHDSEFGGGDGTYYGRWCDWSVDTLKRMLDESGFAYEDGETVKFLPV